MNIRSRTGYLCLALDPVCGQFSQADATPGEGTD